MLWSMVFLRRDYFSILPQYFAYLGCIFILFSYLSYLKISMTRILWAVFILASLPVVILESTSAQNNLIVAFFLFVSFYLFVYGVRENDKKAVIFSAIAFSIDLGIKTTVFFFIPIFGLIYLLVSIREKKTSFYKPLFIFLAVSIPAFLLLSSYNYILNYINFGNPLGTKFFIYRHSIELCFNTFMANLTRYFLLFFDFTGIKAAESLTPFYLNIKSGLFNLFGLNSSDGLLFLDLIKINVMVHENLAKFGLLGFLLILPLILRYSFSKLTSSRGKSFYINTTGLFTIGFILTISALMGFCIWNNRYLLSAVVLSSPLLILSYTKKITLIKIMIMLIVLFNYLIIPISNAAKPLFEICKLLTQYDFNSFRQEVRFRNEGKFSNQMQYYYITKYLGTVIPDNSKIGLIFTDDDWSYPLFEENTTWKIYPLRYELLLKKKNFDDYDFLVIAKGKQNIEMISDDNIVYNYTVKGDKVDYKKVKPGIPVVVYYDKNIKPVTSGKPVYQINMLNVQDIPDNFKRIKKLEIIETKEKVHKFFVYKKI
jgi:hypothetical protein